jgi:GT2 family glycosyltransferase
MLQNKFAIGIPTLNRFDLLYPALLFYVNDFPNTKIFVVDNGKQGISDKIKHPNIKVIESETNLGVAKSWNLLCDMIYEQHDYAIILNDDIYWGRKEYELDNLFSNYKEDFFVGNLEWCVFVLPKATYLQVGKFDEDFYPAYYEDNDYAYRMKLVRKFEFKVPFFNPFIYKASQTLEKDSSIKHGFVKNGELYVKKWGGKPNQEKFKRPYDGKI